jgi:DNA-binding HxlR family transcriptional regulator
MWQVVSGIGLLQVIAICRRRHRTARERWWQAASTIYVIATRPASEPRSGCAINATVEVIGDHWSLLVLAVDLRGDGA